MILSFLNKRYVVLAILAGCCQVSNAQNIDCRASITEIQANDCEAIDNTRNKKNCLDNHIKKIKKNCLGNSAKKSEANKKSAALNQLLLEKSNRAITSEGYRLSQANADLSHAANIMKHYQRGVDLLKTEIVNYMSTVRSLTSLDVSQFQRHINRHIQTINGTNDLRTLATAQRDIEKSYLVLARQINGKLNDFALLQMKARVFEDRVLESLATSYATLENNDLSIDLGFQSSTVNKAITYLHTIDDDAYAKTQHVLATLSQKVSLNRFKSLDEEYQAIVHEMYLLRRSRDYLEEITQSINQFRQRNRSKFKRLPYVNENLEAAKALITIANTCSAATPPTWQSLGCHNVERHKGNAERQVQSTTARAIAFTIRVLERENDTGLTTKANALKAILESGDLDNAALMHDEILRELSSREAA